MKKLAIVGSHPDTRELAPYDHEDYEIWLFNEAPQKPEIYRRWDASFQMHKPEIYASLTNWVNDDHWQWLQQDHGDRTIWMMAHDPRVPNSKRYPLEGVLELVPYKYLRSTPALALALAVYLGYPEIALYGSELSSNTEYGYQALNMAFWIGFINGRPDITFDLQCWQSEFEQPIYGYEGELQIPRDFFELRIDDLETATIVNRHTKDKLYGKLTDALYGNSPDKVAELLTALESMTQKAGEAQGALNEARRYYERENPISRQEYERVCATAQRDGELVKEQTLHKGGMAEYVWNVWVQTGAIEARNQLKGFIDEKIELTYQTGIQLGIFRENNQNMMKYDEYVTAAGGHRAIYQAEKIMMDIDKAQVD